MKDTRPINEKQQYIENLILANRFVQNIIPTLVRTIPTHRTSISSGTASTDHPHQDAGEH